LARPDFLDEPTIQQYFYDARCRGMLPVFGKSADPEDMAAFFGPYFASLAGSAARRIRL
jgi:hypothetical protein